MTHVYEVQLTEAYEPHQTYGMYSTKEKAIAGKEEAIAMIKQEMKDYGYMMYSHVEIEEHHLQ